MANFENDSIVVLRDASLGISSMGCETCGTVTTHRCSYYYEQFNPLLSNYECERDRTDSVWVLSCKRCGVVDLTPFLEDVWASEARHDELHNYVQAVMDSGADPSLTTWDLQEEYRDTLRGEAEMEELARENRCLSWERYAETTSH